MSRKKPKGEEAIKLGPPWKLMTLNNGKRNFYLNLETREIVYPENVAARFASNSSDIPSTSKQIPQGALEMAENPDEFEHDSYELMDWEVASIIKEIRSKPTDNNEEVENISTIGVKQLKYRKTRSGMIVVFDTSALIKSPDIVQQSGRAKIPMRIPYTVIKELDGLKKNETLRAKINGILRDMNLTHLSSPDLLSYENSADCSLPFLISSEFSSEMVRFEVTNKDDNILKTALMLRKHVKDSSIKILLVTNDLNMTAKAIAHDISVADDRTYLAEYIAKVNQARAAIEERKEPGRERKTTEMKKEKAISKTIKGTVSQKIEKAAKKKRSSEIPLVDLTHSPSPHPTEVSIQKEVKMPRKKESLPVSSQMDNNPSNPITSWHYPEKISVFTFDSELKKFLYIFRVSVEKAIYLLTNENLLQMKELLHELCTSGYLFIQNAFGIPELAKFLDLLENLYEKTIRRLNKHQRIDKDQLARELAENGAEGEGINAIREFGNKIVNEFGWVPPFPPK